MIRSWANSATQKFAETGKCKFSGLDEDYARDLLLALDAAATLSHISPFRSIRLHALKGDRKGQWAMTVNGPWRICFEFRNGDAHDVEIADYH